MKVILLGFLSLFTFAETARKFTLPDVELPGDYWEEEKEDDDDEKATNVEHSPDGTGMKSLSAVGQTKGWTMEHLKDEVSLAFVLATSEIHRFVIPQLYNVQEWNYKIPLEPVSLLDDGVDLLKKTMQNLQEKESRLGPHYLTTLIHSHREEELPLDVSHKADLLERNTAQETRKEDCKVNVALIVSCVVFGCIYILLIYCWMAVIKHRLKKWIASTGFRGKFP